MRSYYYLVALCCFFLGSEMIAQTGGCDGTRYRTTVFNAVDTTDFVQYGSNTTVNGNPQDLYMTIYEPQGDTVSKRPTIVLAFGGSFISGDRYQLEDLCENFAQRGYVVAAIDYRLYDKPLFPLPDSIDMIEVVLGAVSDMKASIRYLREDAATQDRFRIDTNYIFSGGVSAGAIAALHAAYLQNSDNIPMYITTLLSAQGGLEGNSSTNFQYSSSVSGVLSYSGALHRSAWIDANDVPLFAVHEEGDGIVPYGFGTANVSAGGFTVPIVTVFGGESITTEATTEGITNVFMSYPDSAHVGYLNDPAKRAVVVDSSAYFLNNEACLGMVSTTSEVERIATELRLYPNPARQNVNVELQSDAGAFYARLVDATGRIVWEQQFDNTRYIEVPQQAAGYYFLRLDFESSERTPVVKPVVFQR